VRSGIGRSAGRPGPQRVGASLLLRVLHHLLRAGTSRAPAPRTYDSGSASGSVERAGEEALSIFAFPFVGRPPSKSPYVDFYPAFSACLKLSQALVRSGTLRIAETTQMRRAPAANTSGRLPKWMPPIANQGTRMFALAQRTYSSVTG